MPAIRKYTPSKRRTVPLLPKKKSSFRKAEQVYDRALDKVSEIASATAGNTNRVGSTVGAAIGSYLGMPKFGASLGSSAQDLFRSITGYGDYKISRNTLIGMGTQAPTIRNSKRTTVIRHREYIGDLSTPSTLVNGSTPFTNNTYLVNAGNSTTFPWLSSVAQNFEFYKFHGILFEFKSTSATALNSTNTSLGTVILASEYNTAQPSYVNKIQMENSEYCTSVKPSECVIHPVECAPKSNPQELYYVNTGNTVPVGQDPRLYNISNFQLATVGMQATNINIGELWVTYEVELSRTALSGALGLAIDTDHWYVPASSTITNSNLFGTSTVGNVLRTGSQVGTVLASNSITFPANLIGNYLVCIQWSGSSSTTTIGSITFTNCSALQVWNNDIQTASSSGAGTGIFVFSVQFIVKLTGSPAGAPQFVGFTGFTVPASSQADLFITQVNGNIIT